MNYREFLARGQVTGAPYSKLVNCYDLLYCMHSSADNFFNFIKACYNPTFHTLSEQKKAGNISRKDHASFVSQCLASEGVDPGIINPELVSKAFQGGPLSADDLDKDGMPKPGFGLWAFPFLEFHVIMKNGEPIQQTHRPLIVDHQRLYEYLINNFNVCHMDGAIAYWNGREYVMGQGSMRTLIRRLFSVIGRKHDPFNDKELVSELSDIVQVRKEHTQEFLVPVLNGVLRLDPGQGKAELLPHSPKHALANAIPVRWTPDARSDELDRALDSWATCDGEVDPEVRALLVEFPAIALVYTQKFKKGLMLVGEKDCGKSSYKELVEDFLGPDNCVSMSLQEAGARFTKILVQNRRAILSDDVESGKLTDNEISTLKKLISGDKMQGEFKGMDAEEFTCHAKLFCMCNTIPRFSDHALVHRLQFIAFRNRFKANARLRDTLGTSEVKEALLVKCVSTLCAMLGRMGRGEPAFTHSVASDMLTEQYVKSVDPVAEWIDGLGDLRAITFRKEDAHPGTKTIKALYEAFKEDFRNMHPYERIDTLRDAFKDAVLRLCPKLTERKLHVTDSQGDHQYQFFVEKDRPETWNRKMGTKAKVNSKVTETGA